MNGEKSWHRRQAVQLAAQLPEATADALHVLEAMRRLVIDFMEMERGSQAEVLALVPASRKRAARDTLRASSLPK